MANSKPSGRVRGVRVDVPSELSPDDFRELTSFCLLFEDGRRCHFGVGETRIFLVNPAHITEANRILKKYGVELSTSNAGA